MGIKVERILITPKIAEMFLQKNFSGNRKLNVNHVKELENEMNNGRWVESNDMICINDKNELINGQHRLTAIVNTSKSFFMTVAIGYPSETFNAMDSGILYRSFKDQIRLISDDPLKRNSTIISFIRNMFISEIKTDELKLSVQRVNELIDKYYGVCLFVYHLINGTHKSGANNTSSLALACVCAAIHGVRTEQLVDFYNVIRENRIDLSKKYNYKAALDFTKTVQNVMLKELGYSTINRSAISNRVQKHEENVIVKKIVWCFINDKKRLPQNDPYPISESELDMFNEICMLTEKKVI